MQSLIIAIFTDISNIGVTSRADFALVKEIVAHILLECNGTRVYKEKCLDKPLSSDSSLVVSKTDSPNSLLKGNSLEQM